MRITKTKMEPTIETTKLTCDKCNQIDVIYGDGDVHVSEFKSSFGYGSDHDQETIEFHLCDDCLFSILDYEKVNYRLKGNGIFDDPTEFDGAI